jgi:hypothetical protein
MSLDLFHRLVMPGLEALNNHRRLSYLSSQSLEGSMRDRSVLCPSASNENLGPGALAPIRLLRLHFSQRVGLFTHRHCISKRNSLSGMAATFGSSRVR